VLLQNHSRRRVSGGQDFEMIVADDAATAGRELAGALERVSQRVVAEQLCVLDNSIGVSVSRLVLKKFQLLRAANNTDRTEQVNAEPEAVYEEPREPLGPPLALAAGVSAGEVIEIE